MRPYVSIDLNMNMYKMNIKWMPNTFFMSSFSVCIAATSLVLDLSLLKLNSVLYIYNSVLFQFGFGLFYVTHFFCSLFSCSLVVLSRVLIVCVCVLVHLIADADRRTAFHTNLFHYARQSIPGIRNQHSQLTWMPSNRKAILIHLFLAQSHFVAALYAVVVSL